jgi:hypothetical protein
MKQYTAGYGLIQGSQTTQEFDTVNEAEQWLATIELEEPEMTVTVDESGDEHSYFEGNFNQKWIKNN